MGILAPVLHMCNTQLAPICLQSQLQTPQPIRSHTKVLEPWDNFGKSPALSSQKVWAKWGLTFGAKSQYLCEIGIN